MLPNSTCKVSVEIVVDAREKHRQACGPVHAIADCVINIAYLLVDADEVATLAAFLEDRHIRALPIEKRAPLRSSGPAWDGAFESYLGDLGCPLITDSQPFSASRLQEYLSWAIGHAFSLDYEDNGALYNSEAAAHIAESNAATSSSSAVRAASILPADAQALVADLAKLCHVKTEGRSLSEVLQNIHRVIRMRILPAVADAEAFAAVVDGDGKGKRPQSTGAGAASSSSSSVGSGAGAEASAFTAMGSGFETGNPLLDKASAILRMLYVADLRELQDAVNDIIVTVQDFVADPKTDSSLGQVGR